MVLTATGCAFHGLNSLPLPGAVGRGPGANIYHVELPNVGTMESNSPVMIDDVVVGSVGPMTVQGWHADVEISVKRDVVVPANVVASVGQTSLLGSMHVELNPPLGQPGSGRLQPGATIPLSRSSTYPSTEQTLSSLGAGRQRRGTGTDRRDHPQFQRRPVRARGRRSRSDHSPRHVRGDTRRTTRQHRRVDSGAESAWRHLRRPTRRSHRGAAQDTARTRCADQGAAAPDDRPGRPAHVQQHRHRAGQRHPGRPGQELCKNLEPTIKALADVGPDFDTALAAVSVFPFTQNFVDRAVRGDYFNLHVQSGPDDSAAQEGPVPGHPLGTARGRAGARRPGTRRTCNYTRDPLLPGGCAAAGAGAPAPLPRSAAGLLSRICRSAVRGPGTGCPVARVRSARTPAA